MEIKGTLEEYEIFKIMERDLLNYVFLNRKKTTSKDYCLKLYFKQNENLDLYLSQEKELLKKYSARIKELKKIYKKHEVVMDDINDCKKIIDDLNDFYIEFDKKYQSHFKN